MEQLIKRPVDLSAETLNSYSHVLPTSYFKKISDLTQLSVDQTKVTLQHAIPIVLRQLKEKIEKPEKVQDLARIIKRYGFDQPASMTSDLANITAHINKGYEAFIQVYKGKTLGIVTEISQDSGLNLSVARKILAAASTAVFSLIGTQMIDGKLTAPAYAKALSLAQGLSPETSYFLMSEKDISLHLRKRNWPLIFLAVVMILVILLFHEAN